MMATLATGIIPALLCGLDRLACGQFMISRPIVAGPLTGLFLGDLHAGLLAGACLELLWMGILPMGATIPPDDTQATVAATVALTAFSAQSSYSADTLLPLVILLVIPFALLGRLPERLVREHNHWKLPEFNGPAAIVIRRVARRHFRGILSFSSLSLFNYLFIATGTLAALHLLPSRLYLEIVEAPAWLRYAIAFSGSVLYVEIIHVRRAFSLFAASFGMGLLLMWMV